MPKVTFQPADVTVEVPHGTLIHEAAIRAGIEDLHLPCGAAGTCGQCLVEILSGSAEQIGRTHFDEVLAGKNLVMACQTKVMDDITVQIASVREASMRVVGDSHFLIGEEYLPDRTRLSTLYRAETLAVPEASVEEHYSDWQRLVRELTKKTGPLPVSCDVWVLRSLSDALRADDGRVTVIVQEEETGLRVYEVRPGHEKPRLCGISVDIGTTTIAVQLVDLLDGRIISSRTSYNAQIRRGADIISRIDYAKNRRRQLEMCRLVLDTINSLIDDVCKDAAISSIEVQAAFIAGNTTMLHLLLALPPKHIREHPYVPAVNAIPSLSASEVGLRINDQAIVAFSPGVGSYVGGDITAGLLCTDIPLDNDNVYLFMDIGTNGEIVIGNADWMVACACSAGPAFEGSGIQCGMRATNGAIEYVDISSDGRDVQYDVIGGGWPEGICGSGLICLLGEMFLHGVIDQSGRFNTDLETDRIVRQDHRTVFVIEYGSRTKSGEDLIITEADIENLMRTKAAIYAACSLILDNIGIGWDAIKKIYIAGGFGRYIQIHDAVLIGLLPDLHYEKFTYIGNSSLTGAYIALLSRESRQRLNALAARMTYVDLSSDPRYMDSYLGAMFLPHTDMSQFPSVQEKLSEEKALQAAG